ncbi:MAG: hypothetical protein WAQ41_04865 [bacterium]|jgi:hypothetical protein|nr:hypothetical protein [Bacillota bacterium]
MVRNRSKGILRRERPLANRVKTFGLPWQSSLSLRGQEICRLYHVLDDETGDGRGEY